jgi:sugar phosphate isomerase/epimerase
MIPMASSAIAAQMYTLRDFCKTAADLAQTASKLKAIGYQAVQVSGIGPVPTADIRKILDDAGLTICGTHTNIETVRDSLPSLITELKTLGCETSAVAYMAPDWRTPEGVKEFCAIMERAGAAMRAEGLWLGYHNHSFEFAKIGDKLMLDLMYEYTTRENIWAEVDTHWIQHGGAEPAAWIRRFKGCMPVVHFKDYGIIGDKPVFMEVGEGNLNWPSILDACKYAGVQWHCVEQDNCNGRDPFESLAISLRNLNAMGLR